MFSRVSKSVSRLLALACVVSIPLALGAQNSAKPAAKAAVGDTPSKWDIFAGYSFFDPNSHVDGTTTLGEKDPVDFKTEKVGTVESVTRYFNDHWGLQIDSGQHDHHGRLRHSPASATATSSTMQAGAVYRWAEQSDKITPWVHALGGGGSLEGPDHQANTPGYTFTAGRRPGPRLTPHWAFQGGRRL